MSGRVRGFTLWLLLCPLAAATEPTLQDVAAPVQSKLEQALPDSLHGEARSAARQLGVDEGSSDGPFSLGDFDRRAPVVIQAGELEATDRDDKRVLVFRRNVEVKQGSLQLTAGELSAVYPSGSSQPSRLEAKGGVVVREGTREARCERVVYDRPARRLDCFGKASMQDGNDRIEGTSIGFDLARRSVAVGGGTEVVFEPRALQTNEQGQLELPSGLPLLRERAPAHVRALNLDASDGPEGRRIAFDGDVTLSQEGTTLRAKRLEAVYPPGADQPDRLIATGDVSLAEGIRQASCERAEYLRLENRVLCEGGVARAGDDRLEGDTIDFALGEEKLSVRGRTRLVLGPREPQETGSAKP